MSQKCALLTCSSLFTVSEASKVYLARQSSVGRDTTSHLTRVLRDVRGRARPSLLLLGAVGKFECSTSNPRRPGVTEHPRQGLTRLGLGPMCCRSHLQEAEACHRRHGHHDGGREGDAVSARRAAAARSSSGGVRGPGTKVRVLCYQSWTMNPL